MKEYMNLTIENIENEHICCAIGDPKHQEGVRLKKAWLKDRIQEGHIFRKLNERGKVFIEYAPLETAWIPIQGDNYLYVYCLWVSGSFKGNHHAESLLNYCIEDALKQKKAGVCVLSSKKKKPYLSDKAFFLKYGFVVVDEIDDYELLALSFNKTKPKFHESLSSPHVISEELCIYYSPQCPLIVNCIKQIEIYCAKNQLPLHLYKIDTLNKAKNLPFIFNNWALTYHGKFETHILMNESMLKKFLEKNS